MDIYFDKTVISSSTETRFWSGNKDEDLEASGASLEDAYIVLQELLTLVHVNQVHLYKYDTNNEKLKLIKEI